MSMPPMSDIDRAKALRLAKLFDLRTFIGALFLIFGLVVTVEGLIAGTAEIDKAAGVNLSLWTGLTMLLTGAIFIGWMLVQPPELEGRHDDLGHIPDVHHH